MTEYILPRDFEPSPDFLVNVALLERPQQAPHGVYVMLSSSTKIFIRKPQLPDPLGEDKRLRRRMGRHSLPVRHHRMGNGSSVLAASIGEQNRKRQSD